MNTFPKVSVVTTTYNDIENLKRIFAEVKKQTYPNIEHIIVDGGSTDGTVDLLKELEEKEPGRISWMSEKDNGIYDAINKGIRMATGEIVGCCFDRYADEGVLMRMVEIMEKEGTDGVHGDLCYMDGDRIVRKWHQGQGVIRSGWMPGHPTLYLKKEVYDRFGLYRTDYRISGDYEFMVRILYRKEVTLSYLSGNTDLYVHGGTSTNSLGAYVESMMEGHRALVENHVPFAWVTDLCRVVRVLSQFVIR